MGLEAKLILQKSWKALIKNWLKYLEWGVYFDWWDIIGYIPVVCVQMQEEEEIKWISLNHRGDDISCCVWSILWSEGWHWFEVYINLICLILFDAAAAVTHPSSLKDLSCKGLCLEKTRYTTEVLCSACRGKKSTCIILLVNILKFLLG